MTKDIVVIFCLVSPVRRRLDQKTYLEKVPQVHPETGVDTRPPTSDATSARVPGCCLAYRPILAVWSLLLAWMILGCIRSGWQPWPGKHGLASPTASPRSAISLGNRSSHCGLSGHAARARFLPSAKTHLLSYLEMNIHYMCPLQTRSLCACSMNILIPSRRMLAEGTSEASSDYTLGGSVACRASCRKIVLYSRPWLRFWSEVLASVMYERFVISA